MGTYHNRVGLILVAAVPMGEPGGATEPGGSPRPSPDGDGHTEIHRGGNKICGKAQYICDTFIFKQIPGLMRDSQFPQIYFREISPGGEIFNLLADSIFSPLFSQRQISLTQFFIANSAHFCWDNWGCLCNFFLLGTGGYIPTNPPSLPYWLPFVLSHFFQRDKNSILGHNVGDRLPQGRGYP